MKKILLAATALTFATSTFALADTYVLDPTHTNVVWHANHLGFSNPSGKFANVTGTITLDEKSPAKSKVEATISTAMVTGDKKFDTHLESADFFDVAKFPTATFVSTKVTPTGKNSAKVVGDLTLLGVTKPVTLNVKLNKIGEHPMSKKKTAGFSATTTIKRSDFGMKYGIPMVSDEIPVSIETEASVE